MRISDWSSDVCSSDLEIERADLGADCVHVEHVHGALLPSVSASNARQIARGPMLGFLPFDCGADEPPTFGDRGEGKRHQPVAKAGIERAHRLIGLLRFREILFYFRIGREYPQPRGL